MCLDGAPGRKQAHRHVLYSASHADQRCSSDHFRAKVEYIKVHMLIQTKLHHDFMTVAASVCEKDYITAKLSQSESIFPSNFGASAEYRPLELLEKKLRQVCSWWNGFFSFDFWLVEKQLELWKLGEQVSVHQVYIFSSTVSHG